MALKLDEVAICKACSVKLDSETVMIVSLLYHTADRKQNPQDHSWYKYEAYIDKAANIEAKAKSMKSLENRLKVWKWENPTWPTKYFMGYDNSNDQGKGARWFTMKLKKLLDWPAYEKLAKYGIKLVKQTGKEQRYPSGAYPTEGYTSDTGESNISILDQPKLLSLCGHFLTYDVPLKRSTT